MTSLTCSLALWALVRTAALEYDLPPEPVYHLIIAESAGNPLAVGDEGKALGLAQFHEGTFVWLADRYDTGYVWPQDAHNAEASIDLLCAALAEGRASLWHGWKRVPVEHRWEGM